jgi:hypothetical protein
MKISKNRLRQIIREALMLEADPNDGNKSSQTTKPGSEGAEEAKGTLNVKTIADTLKVDPAMLSRAVANLRKGTRSANDNKVFGDVVAKLIEASPEDTVKVMNVFKKVASGEG